MCFVEELAGGGGDVRRTTSDFPLDFFWSSGLIWTSWSLILYRTFPEHQTVEYISSIPLWNIYKINATPFYYAQFRRYNVKWPSVSAFYPRLYPNKRNNCKTYPKLAFFRKDMAISWTLHACFGVR